MPIVLDGKRIRDEILREAKPRVDALAARHRPPGLAVILAGHDPASEIYVKGKVKACGELGIRSETFTPPESVTTSELLAMVDELNRRPDIDGILVQLPLPAGVDAKRVLLAVDPAKDVDGFHPFNIGCLVANQPAPRACTPAGIMELLRRYDIPIAGKRAVIVGRSDIVGKPMALLLLHANATVTICHSKTADLAAECRRADLLVAAIGKAGLITSTFLNSNVVVIDVGMNRVFDRDDAIRLTRGSVEKTAEFDRKGQILVGDVNPLDVQQTAAYTPVPGGVGPLTIAMLMVNTIDSATRRLHA